MEYSFSLFSHQDSLSESIQAHPIEWLVTCLLWLSSCYLVWKLQLRALEQKEDQFNIILQADKNHLNLLKHD